MGWLDRIKQGLEQAKDEAEDIAAIGNDLSEAGASLPAEIAALCREADTFADQIKAKEAEIAKVKAG
jgi:hypothetical protein